jgi:hypothetical protein
MLHRGSQTTSTGSCHNLAGSSQTSAGSAITISMTSRQRQANPKTKLNLAFVWSWNDRGKLHNRTGEARQHRREAVTTSLEAPKRRLEAPSQSPRRGAAVLSQATYYESNEVRPRPSTSELPPCYWPTLSLWHLTTIQGRPDPSLASALASSPISPIRFSGITATQIS